MKRAKQLQRKAIEEMWDWFLKSQFPLGIERLAKDSNSEEVFEYLLKSIYPMAPLLNDIAILIGTSKSTVSRRFRALEKKHSAFHHGSGKGRRFFLTPKVIESLDPRGARVKDMHGRGLGYQDPELDELVFIPGIAGKRDFRRYMAEHNQLSVLGEEASREAARQEENDRAKYKEFERIMERLPALEKGGEKLWRPLLWKQADLLGGH